MKEKVFVTGGSGFLGAELIKQLICKGYRVKALKRNGSDTSFLNDYEGQFEWVTGDVLDIISLEEAIEDVDYVFHTAAMISFDSRLKEKMFKINVEGTTNMVNTCLKFNVKKYLHFSSINAFGTYKFSKPIDENTKWLEHPNNTDYAISKHLGELEVWRAKEEGLPVIIANLSTIIGKGNWDIGSSQIFRQVYKGIPFYPKGSIGFVSVEDCAKVSIQLMESPIKNEQFIINSENLTYKELFEMIAKEFNVKPPERPLSKFIQEIGWRYFWVKSKLLGIQPMITKKTTRFTSWDYAFKNDKIKQALNFTFEPIQDAVKRAVNFYKNQI